MFRPKWSPNFLLFVAGIAFPSASLAQSNATGTAGNAPGYVFDCADVTIDFKDNPNLTGEEKVKLMDRALSESLSRFDSCQQAMQEMRQPETPKKEDPSAAQTNAARAEAEASQSGTKQSKAAKAATESQQKAGGANRKENGTRASKAPKPAKANTKPTVPSLTSPLPPSPIPPSAAASVGAQTGTGFKSVPSADMSGTENLNAENTEATPAANARVGGAGGAQAAGAANTAGSAGAGLESVASASMSGTEKLEKPEAPGGGGLTKPSAGDVPGGGGGAVGAGTRILSNGKIPEDIPPADNDSVLEAQIRQAAINETDPEIKAKLWNEYRKYKGLPPIK